MTAAILLAVLLGYALGGVPTGVLVTRLLGAPDVRHVGSGHTGGTNVVRATGCLWAGVATGLVDVARRQVCGLTQSSPRARILAQSDDREE